MDSTIKYESKKRSPLINEIKQFPTKTIEKQTTGLKRSITTAAFFAFIIPSILFILYIMFPFSKYPVSIYMEHPDNQDTTTLHVANIGFSIVDQMTINLEFGHLYIQEVSFDIPDTCYAEVSRIGVRRKANDDANDAPFRCAFKIENLGPDDELKIKIKLDYPLEKTRTFPPLKLGEMPDSGVFIPWWSGWKLFKYFWSPRNILYFSLLILALFFLYFLVTIYWRSFARSGILEDCLTFIVEDLQRPRETPEWMYMSMENLFIYWMKMGEENTKAPPTLKGFRSFVLKYDMMKESENRSVIYFAPFDVLGSPTFTRMISRNRKVLFLEFESEKLQRYRVASLEELLGK